MQKLHRPRSAMRAAGAPRPSATARGFSLIELMVTIGVVTILAAIAFAGMRQNQFEGQYRRFVQDVRGTLVSARNYAIDEQTPVRLIVRDDEIVVSAWDGTLDDWNPIPIQRIIMSPSDDALMMTDERVCICGFGEGVQTPSQFADVTPPADCLAGEQELHFQPDGTFTDPLDAFLVPNSGVSLWIADRSITDNERRAIVQVFPGGLIRVFDNIKMGDP